MTIEERSTPTPPRSRRAILAGVLGGVAAVVAGRFASPDKTSAVHLPGFGHANAAGAADTSLTATTAGTALLVTQSGTGTALRGSATGPGSIAGFFTAGNGTGISGVTGTGGSYGVFASNNGAAGAAGALRAFGGNNHGIVATTANENRNAITASTNVTSGIAILATNTSSPEFGVDAGVGVRALNFGATEADLHPGGQYTGTAGEFAGHNGVVGASNSDGAGVVGLSPLGYAVFGQSTSGNGVRGLCSSGDGVFGSSGSGSGVRGNGSTGNGVYGTATSGYGIRGDATSGIGVVGTSQTYRGIQGDSSVNIGVAGSSISYDGVYGSTQSGAGVEGAAASGVGVRAYSANGYGLYASTFDGTAVVVAGDATIDGDLDVTGNVNKAGGTFKIDHPLDPANKFLYHSFVESPDMKNVYDGVVTLDAQGEATVKLPAWFEKLNKDFRYQLTPIGPTDRVLYVKSKLKGDAFSIGGGGSGQEVSWQLTGIRHDAWANANRVVAEVAKTGAEKGRFLHPKEHGQPASKGIAALRKLPAAEGPQPESPTG